MAETAQRDEQPEKAVPLVPEDRVEVFRNGRLVMVGTVCAIDKTMSRTERSTRITITDDQLELIS